MAQVLKRQRLVLFILSYSGPTRELGMWNQWNDYSLFSKQMLACTHVCTCVSLPKKVISYVLGHVSMVVGMKLDVFSSSMHAADYSELRNQPSLKSDTLRQKWRWIFNHAALCSTKLCSILELANLESKLNCSSLHNAGGWTKKLSP